MVRLAEANCRCRNRSGHINGQEEIVTFPLINPSTLAAPCAMFRDTGKSLRVRHDRRAF